MGEWKQIETTASRIQKALAITGMKQSDLVEATGLNKSTVSRYLSGQIEPKQKATGLLARALGVDEMWLWGYDVPMERSKNAKKNDAIVDVVTKLRKDSDFFDVVSMLAELPAEQYASIKQLVSALRNK